MQFSINALWEFIKYQAVLGGMWVVRVGSNVGIILIDEARPLNK